MRLRILVTAFVFVLLPSIGLLAQDSSHVNWTATAAKTAPGKFEVTLKGQVKTGWHLYAKPDATVGLAGVVVKAQDESVNADTISFVSALEDYRDPIFENSNQKVARENVEIKMTINVGAQVPDAVKLQVTYDVAQKDNFIPEEQQVSVKLEGGGAVKVDTTLSIPSINLDAPASDVAVAGSSMEKIDSKGYFSVFLLGLIGGFIALIMPCLFPMIPLTVSFFTKKAQSRKQGVRNATLYGFFIFLIYVLITIPFHFASSLKPEIFNNISTNVYLNIIFFIVFVVFAFSFFGYFEITLPSSFSSKADSKANSGNIGGIFFMALTLVIVSFSCTGPLIGTLLAGTLSGDGGAMKLTVGMAGFGLALALPFALFAMFPNWLNSIPKSGGWLTTVKVVFGFIELGAAFKFLSNADLVMHWGILKREIFIGIWVIISALLTLYLFNIIKFKHEGPVRKIPKVRLILGFLSAAFTLYLIPGVTNNPKWNNLSLISGFPPPLYYSIYQQKSDCILSLNCTRDYNEGLKMAREQNKPMLIDFTGYACVNCRRMEENVWTKPDVYQLLHEKFIIVSLYVDDKKKLPANQQFTYTTKDGLVKEIKTVGDKWATFQTENFKNNSQPWYAVMNTNEELMTHPVGYVPDSKEYLKWLQAGYDAFVATTKK